MSDIRFNSWYHQSGTGGVYQDGSGNIGIGTTVPTATLDVDGAVNATSFNATGIITASSIRFNSWYHQSGTGGVHQDGSGNIGIGLTQPTAELDVDGAVNATSFNATSFNATGIITASSFDGDGSNLTGIDTGDFLQVVHYDFSATTTGTIGVGTITPTSSSNKVLVFLSSSMYGYRASNRGTTNQLALERPDTNQIYLIQASWDQNGAADTSNWHQFNVAGHYLDSPGSTSAQTYYLKFTASNTGSSNSTMMTLIEVKGV